MKGVALAFAALGLLLAVGTANSQQRPTMMGVSGGNAQAVTIKNNNNSSFTFCCGGTLGALVEDSDGVQYVLGANHVLARVNMGNLGDAIVQPSPPDQNCQVAAGSAVANLSRFVSIQYGALTTNTVDAAIAQVVPGQVQGQLQGIGNISGVTLAVSPSVVGLEVQKAGPQTGVTTGVIKRINGRERITFANSGVTQGGVAYTPAQEATWCHFSPNAAKQAVFVNQIEIKGTSKTFAKAGDSGSLVVTTSSCPISVGLAIALDKKTGIVVVSPIGPVLSQLGLTGVVGTCPSQTAADEEAAAETSNPYAAAASQVASVVQQNQISLLTTPGVSGVGYELGDNGQMMIDVWVDDPGQLWLASSNVPGQIQGIPVNVMATPEVDGL